jgi:hypothetical protein
VIEAQSRRHGKRLTAAPLLRSGLCSRAPAVSVGGSLDLPRISIFGFVALASRGDRF